MEQLSRVNLYQRMMDEMSINETNQYTAVITNINLLSKIEDMFLTDDRYEESTTADQEPNWGPDIRTVLDFFEENLQNIPAEGNLGNNPGVKALRTKSANLLSEYRNKEGANLSRHFFNKLINLISDFNQKMALGRNELELPHKEGMPQVFLSHAYDDRLYTYALFRYFYEQEIFLYVDWMHNGLFRNGVHLKASLQKELLASSQLLFMRTINSELDIQGKQMLRPWCAWELGNFYHSVQPDEKYLLNLYSVDEYRNLQLHGLKIFTGVSNRRLQGELAA